MKKIMLTLSLGLLFMMGQAQNPVDYMIVKQGDVEHRYLLSEVVSVLHSGGSQVTVSQKGRADTYDVLTVDSIYFVNAQESTIPDDLIDPMRDYMPIYEGNNPPNIEGCYFVSPCELVYSSDGMASGTVFVDYYYQFSNQDELNKTVDLYDMGYNGGIIAQNWSEQSYIMGDGNNFTVYFDVSGVSHYDDGDATSKLVYLISGTVGDDGITDFYQGYIMKEKNDPNNHLMDVGTYRVLYDGDGWSPKTTMPTSTLRYMPASGDGILLPTERAK